MPSDIVGMVLCVVLIIELLPIVLGVVDVAQTYRSAVPLFKSYVYNEQCCILTLCMQKLFTRNCLEMQKLNLSV